MNQSLNFRQNLLNVTKKAAFTFALFLTLGATYSFARPIDGVNGEIKSAFTRNFQHAELMTTEVRRAFTKLTFKMDGQILSAFYSETGDLLAVTHNIVSTQLPVSLQTSLKNDYKGFWITELFEFTGDEQNCHYVSLENGDSKVTLRSNGDSWELYSSVKK